jgi:hypothetical protein
VSSLGRPSASSAGQASQSPSTPSATLAPRAPVLTAWIHRRGGCGSSQDLSDLRFEFQRLMDNRSRAECPVPATGSLFTLARVHPAGSIIGLCRRCLTQRTGLQMKWLAYFLILLLISAQVDDAWTAAPVLPSAPLADDNDDNDEYVPAQRQPWGEQSSSRQKPVFDAVKPRTADFPFGPRSVPSEWNLTTPSAPPPLYVFMSLQI